MHCDQVFDILTRGPFPGVCDAGPGNESATGSGAIGSDGASGSDGGPICGCGGTSQSLEVEGHLLACHECRLLAESLRPAVELWHEALPDQQQLPSYRGQVPALAGRPPLADQVLAAIEAAASPDARPRLAATELVSPAVPPPPSPPRRAWVQRAAHAGIVLMLLIATLPWLASPTVLPGGADWSQRVWWRPSTSAISGERGGPAAPAATASLSPTVWQVSTECLAALPLAFASRAGVSSQAGEPGPPASTASSAPAAHLDQEPSGEGDLPWPAHVCCTRCHHAGGVVSTRQTVLASLAQACGTCHR